MQRTSHFAHGLGWQRCLLPQALLGRNFGYVAHRPVSTRQIWKKKLAHWRTWNAWSQRATNKVIHRLVGRINPSKKPAKQLTGFAARLRAQRKKAAADTDAVPHTNKKAFQASDFEFLCDKLNAGLGGSTSVSSSDPRLLSGDKFLRCVNLRMSPEAVCTPLICPLMLHLTLSLLPQPWCLKVSTDGTYRLLFEQYTLLTLGVNVKKRQEGASYAFRSSFVPLAFCFAHVEDGGAYGPFAQTVMEVAQAIGHPLNASHVLQFHGDLHKGVESRSAVFPHSQRLSDWAHATGATSQGPSGLHGYFHQVFGDSQLTCFLLQWCRISRTMTLLLFHEVWSHIFAMLEELDYAQVARNIQRQYFQCVAGPGDVSLWSAPWRSGPDRIMPGTDAGSAPQESWHGNSLKPAFAVRKYDPFELATHLQATIVDPQLQDLQGRMKDDASFEDWPAVGKYFDQHILHNSCALAKEGRVPPQALLGLNLHQSFPRRSGKHLDVVAQIHAESWLGQVRAKESLQAPRSWPIAAKCCREVCWHGQSHFKPPDQRSMAKPRLLFSRWPN